jgi:phosphoglycolate phosphatase-like HAD superfamily hydrolase
MLKGIAFDYDGTIGQTMERQFEWFKFWAQMNHKQLPFDKLSDFIPFYNHHCGRTGGVQNVYDEFDLPCNMNDREHPVWAAYEAYKESQPAAFYPRMKDTILKIWELGHLTKDPLRNRRLRLAINTTNTWKSIYSSLKSEGVLHCFDGFITEEVLRAYHGAGQPDSIKKPSKISLAMVLGLIDSEGDTTLHIGDTLHDLAASQKVVLLNPQRPETLLTVGAAWGYEGRSKLEEGVEVANGTRAYFNYIIDSPEQLIPIVEKHLD